MKYLSYSHYFTWRHWGVLYGLVALFSFAPLLSAIVASFLSRVLGCGEANEVFAPNCPGGSVIEVLFLLSWFGLITFPFGIFLGFLLIIANLLWHFTRKSGQDRL